MRRRTALASLCAAALLPSGALAQQPGKVYRVGFLGQRPLPWLVEPLAGALHERGWRVGRNLLLDVRVTGGDIKRADDMAKELVDQRVDAIVVAGTHMALSARRATATVPIVMYLSGYPVEAGLVASFARPGGNVTGLSTYGGDALYGKFMSLLRELLPSLRELAVFWDYAPPAFPGRESELSLGELRKAAGALNVGVRVWTNKTDSDLSNALSALAQAPTQALF